MGVLPSIRAPVIQAARPDKSWKVGFQTSKGGVLEWSLVGKGGPLPWAELGPWLFLAGDGVESLLVLLLLE